MIRSKSIKTEYHNNVSAEENEKRRCGLKDVEATDMLWLFVGGSVIGFVLEGLWHILRVGTWESHTATVWGPFQDF